MDVHDICQEIVFYMAVPSVENAKKLYKILHNKFPVFLSDCLVQMMRMDIDGDYPYEKEWCDNFIIALQSKLRICAMVETCGTQYIMQEPESIVNAYLKGD